MQPLHSTKDLFYTPPEQQSGAFGYTGYTDLLRASIFPPSSQKQNESPQSELRYSGTSVRSRHHPPSPSPYPEDRPVARTQRILIEPSRVEHPVLIRNVMAALPSTIGRIVESWSGETSASQVTVLRRMIKELDTTSQSQLNRCMDGKGYLDNENLRQLLKPLCGPEGTLCSVDRKGAQSGVSSISCSKCDKSFHSNPVQAFAHHLISEHWKIKVFACYAPDCPKRFSWSQDRDRHEKSKHNAYRRKAYEVAMKQELRREVPVKQESRTCHPDVLMDPRILSQAFGGYDPINNRWE